MRSETSVVRGDSCVMPFGHRANAGNATNAGELAYYYYYYYYGEQAAQSATTNSTQHCSGVFGDAVVDFVFEVLGIIAFTIFASAVLGLTGLVFALCVRNWCRNMMAARNIKAHMNHKTQDNVDVEMQSGADTRPGAYTIFDEHDGKS